MYITYSCRKPCCFIKGSVCGVQFLIELFHCNTHPSHFSQMGLCDSQDQEMFWIYKEAGLATPKLKTYYILHCFQQRSEPQKSGLLSLCSLASNLPKFNYACFFTLIIKPVDMGEGSRQQPKLQNVKYLG